MTTGKATPQALTPDIEQRCRKIEEAADQLVVEGADWVTFFNRILGVDGLVRSLFPRPEDWKTFENTPTYHRVQYLLTMLRSQQGNQPKKDEPLTMITVRVPKSIQEALAQEAWELRTSINRLCISKLLQIIDQEYVPQARQFGGRRSSGRRERRQHEEQS
ncbi:hypothetical protein JCM19992_26000 [Thermostilla marina]